MKTNHDGDIRKQQLLHWYYGHGLKLLSRPVARRGWKMLEKNRDWIGDEIIVVDVII
jgi:hypothetical protein